MSYCYSWMGLQVQVVLPQDTISHFCQHNVVGKGKAQATAWKVVWVAIMCCIWNFRNKIVFRHRILASEDLLESIRIKTWMWLKTNVKGFSYSMFEWINSSDLCLSNMEGWVWGGFTIQLGVIADLGLCSHDWVLCNGLCLQLFWVFFFIWSKWA